MAKWEVKVTGHITPDVRKPVAEAIAGMVMREFKNLLKDAPQYSGNFVANVAVSGGSIPQKSGELFYDPTPDLSSAFSRGNLSAISTSLKQTGNIVAKLTAGITEEGGWLPDVITIYNRINYGEYVEELKASQLRDVNREGAHPFEKTYNRLSDYGSSFIAFGTPEFESLRRENDSI